MQQAFLDINGVRTSVLTYGKWVEELKATSQPEDIILIIPGNPGVTGFYKMFMHTLHEKTGMPVWIVGHAGHEIPKNNTVYAISSWEGNENIFGLQGQIEHKISFIKKYVPENARLHLIGHSIGSYMILELLSDESVSSKVVDVKLLFPTVEYMAETSNGKFLLNIVKPIIWLIVFLSMIYTILPSVLRNFLTLAYMKIVSLPKMHFKTIIQFIHPSIMKKVFYLALEEMDQVRERNDKVIQENFDKIRFLYGANDGWAPPSYCDKLKFDLPGVKAELSQFDHAFVLKQSREVGNFVADWISSQ